MKSSMDKAQFTRQILDAKQTMFRVAFAILQNTQDCEDAAANAVSKAYGTLHQLKNEAYFRTWLIRILKNECYEMLRKRKRTVPLEECEAVAAEDRLPDVDLHRALMRLTKNQRIVITLYHLEGYSVAEVARIMGRPEGTVKSWLARTRQELRVLLNGDDEE